MEKLREDILSMPIGEVLNDMKNGMDLASRSGDICATVEYANRVNALEDAIVIEIECKKLGEK